MYDVYNAAKTILAFTLTRAMIVDDSVLKYFILHHTIFHLANIDIVLVVVTIHLLHAGRENTVVRFAQTAVGSDSSSLAVPSASVTSSSVG